MRIRPAIIRGTFLGVQPAAQIQTLDWLRQSRFARRRAGRIRGPVGNLAFVEAELEKTRPRHDRKHYGMRGSVQQRYVPVLEQFFENKRIRLLALAPEHHQNDDFELVERHRDFIGCQSPLDHDLSEDWT